MLGSVPSWQRVLQPRGSEGRKQRWEMNRSLLALARRWDPMPSSAQAGQWGLQGGTWAQAAPLLPSVQCQAAGRAADTQLCTALPDWEQHSLLWVRAFAGAGEDPWLKKAGSLPAGKSWGFLHGPDGNLLASAVLLGHLAPVQTCRPLPAPLQRSLPDDPGRHTWHFFLGSLLAPVCVSVALQGYEVRCALAANAQLPAVP